MDNFNINNGKTIAIISYITWIGTLIAFIMNNDKRNQFAAFHIRQMIGLSIFSLVNTFILGAYTSNLITSLVSTCLFVLWIIGLLGAAKGEKKSVPLVGDLFQDWFKRIA